MCSPSGRNVGCAPPQPARNVFPELCSDVSQSVSQAGRQSVRQSVSQSGGGHRINPGFAGKEKSAAFDRKAWPRKRNGGLGPQGLAQDWAQLCGRRSHRFFLRSRQRGDGDDETWPNSGVARVALCDHVLAMFGSVSQKTKNRKSMEFRWVGGLRRLFSKKYQTLGPCRSSIRL